MLHAAANKSRIPRTALANLINFLPLGMRLRPIAGATANVNVDISTRRAGAACRENSIFQESRD
jgi:hypothetical protein